MANAGLEITCQDGSGALQIDNTYRNFFLRGKYTVTLTDHNLFTGATSCGEKVINVVCQTTPLVVFALASGSSSMVASDLLISPPASGHGTPGTYAIDIVGPLNAVVDVYIFDALTDADIGGSTYGLQVWNAAGQIIFDAAAKPLRIVGKLTASQTSSPTGIAIPSGKKYGVLCNGGYYTTTTGSPVTYLYFGFGGAITSTGYATIGVIQTGSSSGSGTILNQSTTAFVVDLTNYG